MLECLCAVDVPRAGAGLLDDGATLDAVRVALRALMRQQAWPLRAPELLQRILRELCRLPAACPRPYALARLTRTATSAELAAAIVDAVAAGPLQTRVPTTIERADLAAFEHGDEVTVVTDSHDHQIDETLYELLCELPRTMAADSVEDGMVEVFSEYELDQDPRVLARQMIPSLLAHGLLRPRFADGGACLYGIDPRELLYVELPAAPRSARRDAQVEALIDVASERVGRSTFAPVGRFVIDAQMFASEPDRLAAWLLRLRALGFDETSIACWITDASPEPTGDVAAQLRWLAAHGFAASVVVELDSARVELARRWATAIGAALRVVVAETAEPEAIGPLLTRQSPDDATVEATLVLAGTAARWTTLMQRAELSDGRRVAQWLSDGLRRVRAATQPLLTLSMLDGAPALRDGDPHGLIGCDTPERWREALEEHGRTAEPLEEPVALTRERFTI